MPKIRNNASIGLACLSGASGAASALCGRLAGSSSGSHILFRAAFYVSLIAPARGFQHLGHFIVPDGKHNHYGRRRPLSFLRTSQHAMASWGSLHHPGGAVHSAVHSLPTALTQACRASPKIILPSGSSSGRHPQLQQQSAAGWCSTHTVAKGCLAGRQQLCHLHQTATVTSQSGISSRSSLGSYQQQSWQKVSPDGCRGITSSAGSLNRHHSRGMPSLLTGATPLNATGVASGYTPAQPQPAEGRVCTSDLSSAPPAAVPKHTRKRRSTSAIPEPAGADEGGVPDPNLHSPVSPAAAPKRKRKPRSTAAIPEPAGADEGGVPDPNLHSPVSPAAAPKRKRKPRSTSAIPEPARAEEGGVPDPTLPLTVTPAAAPKRQRKPHSSSSPPPEPGKGEKEAPIAQLHTHATSAEAPMSSSSSSAAAALSLAAKTGAALASKAPPPPPPQPAEEIHIPNHPTTTPAASIAAEIAGPVNLNPSRFSYCMLVAYDGTDYNGWQLQPQPDVATVQRCIESALCTMLQVPREKLGVMAAGRTDSGVHAKGQVVQFYADKHMDVSKVPQRVCSLLPPDIRVYSCFATAPDFHVSMSATRKVYHYLVDTSPVHDPLQHRYRLHYRQPLTNLPAMREAAQMFIGEHDFTQFTNSSFDRCRKEKDAVKLIYRVDIVLLGHDGDTLEVYHSLEQDVGTQTDTETNTPVGLLESGDLSSRRSPGVMGNESETARPKKGSWLDLFESTQPSGGSDGDGASRVEMQDSSSSSSSKTRSSRNVNSNRGRARKLLRGSSDSSSSHPRSFQFGSSGNARHQFSGSASQSPTYPQPEQFSGLRLELEGQGFLFRQVRHMVGALLEVGAGRLSVGKLAQRLDVGGKQRPGLGGQHRGWKVADAKGLLLHSVTYPPGVDDPTTLMYPNLTAADYQQRLFNHDNAE